MGSIDDLRAALANKNNRRRFVEARLACCQRQLAEALKTVKTLTQLAASKPGLVEVGVIAPAALLGTLDIDDEPPRSGGGVAVAAR
jgi:hypothetical protein